MLKVLNLIVNGSLRSLKSVKPNWMEDVEGVNCLLRVEGCLKLQHDEVHIKQVAGDQIRIVQAAQINLPIRHQLHKSIF